MIELSKGKKCVNTDRNTNWAIGVFKEWMKQRNESCPDDLCPEEFLEANHSDDVVQLKNGFVDSSLKPESKTEGPTLLPLCKICCPEYWGTCEVYTATLLTFCRRKTGDLDSFGAQWRLFILTSVYKELQLKWSTHLSLRKRRKIDCGRRRSWVQTLRNSSFRPFLLCRKGILFCGGVEQWGLKISQFQRRYGPDLYVYVENGSKNNSGANLKVKNKVVPVYVNPDNPSRCVVALLDKYLSKLPPTAYEKDIFYMRPKPLTLVDADSTWYEGIPIGKETLRTMRARMCERAGVERKSNHSVRATGAMEMFAANVPEKLILSRTSLSWCTYAVWEAISRATASCVINTDFSRTSEAEEVWWRTNQCPVVCIFIQWWYVTPNGE